MARIPAEVLENHIRDVSEKELTTAGMLELAKRHQRNRQKNTLKPLVLPTYPKRRPEIRAATDNHYDAMRGDTSQTTFFLGVTASNSLRISVKLFYTLLTRPLRSPSSPISASNKDIRHQVRARRDGILVQTADTGRL